MNKKISILTIGILGILIIGSISSPSFAREQAPETTRQSPEFVPGQIIVGFTPNANANEIKGLYEKFSNSNVSQIKSLDHKIQNQFDLQERLVKVPEGQERKFLEIFAKNPHVQIVSLDYIVHTTDTIPNDSLFSDLWGMHNTGQTGGTADADIDAPFAWDTHNGTTVTVVGVIDTGVDYTHPDLVANMWINPGEIPGNGVDDDLNGYIDDVHGINAILNNGDPMDDNSHGTHVAGTIGGVGNNGNGVVGVNWNVSIIGCKFLAASGSGSTSDAVECVEYLNALKYTYGVNIVATNNSWSGGSFNAALFSAFEAVGQTDKILHVMAASNDNLDNDVFPVYPANYNLPNKLTVAATDHKDNIAGFSNYGSTSVHLSAPGSSIFSTLPGGGYGYKSGTSMATPHVVGAVALISSNNPSLSYDSVKNVIVSTVDPIPQSKLTITNGRLNIGNALSGDTDAPSATTITIDQTGFSTIDIAFTATGDDGNSGVASYYDVRYSTSPINDDLSWGVATTATGEPTPQSTGSPETFEITGLKSGTIYYVGLKIGDDGGNQSPLSNVPSTTTDAGVPLLDDDVEDGEGTWNTLAGGLWHISSYNPNSPTNSWYYGDETQRNYDVNTTFGTLNTASLNLSDAQEVQLIFSEWSEVEADPTFDRTIVRVSTDGGANWAEVFESHGTAGWEERIVDLSSFAPSSIIVGFYFDSQDGIYNDYEGWYIDDVKISKLTATNPTNNPPVPYDQSVETDEDTPLPITLLATDLDDDPLSYSIASGPSNGSLTGIAPNVTYTPDADYNGPDSFTFKANDGFVDGNIATIDITVNPVNDLPVATPDEYSTFEETPLNVPADGILGNDTDDDGDTLTAVLDSDVSDGVLTLNGDGSFSYTPDANFDGEDSFTYHASDGTSSNIVTVTITVDPINDIHLHDMTGDSNGKKRWRGTITIFIFDDVPAGFTGATVSGMWGGITNDICVTDSGQCQVSQTTRDSSMTFSINSITGSGVNHEPSLDEVPSEITVYRDGSTTIPGPNLPPVAVDDDETTFVDQDVDVDVLDNDSDPNGDTLTIQSFTQGTFGTVSVQGNGILRYSPSSGYDGQDSFGYTINDGNGETASATVNIDVDVAPPGVMVHVYSIDMTSENANGPFWRAIATVTVHDLTDGVHSGVVVNGEWSGSMNDSDSCVTDSFGVCSVNDKSKSNSDAIFTITSLSGTGFVHTGPDHETSDSIGPPP